MRSVTAIRFLTFRVPLHSTLPPLMSLSGHNPIHELNAPAPRNFEMPDPNSARMVSTSIHLRPQGQVDPESEARRSQSRQIVQHSGKEYIRNRLKTVKPGTVNRELSLLHPA